MSAALDITGGTIRVDGSRRQELRNAIEVSDARQLDILLNALALEGSSSPTAVIKLLTGMQKHAEDGWVTALTFTTVSAGNIQELKQCASFLRYIRWDVTLTGSGPAVVFSLAGMARGD